MNSKQRNSTNLHIKPGNEPKPHIAGSIILSALIIGLFSCGNPSKPKTGMMANNSGPKYSLLQQLFCLNMLSNISAMYNYDAENLIIDSTNYAVKTVLADTGVQGLMGQWKPVWGPGVLIIDTKVKSKKRFGKKTDSAVAANTMYIAQSQADTNMYVIAIAGTNEASTFDWEVEDGDVLFIKYWHDFIRNFDTTTQKIIPMPDSPFISRAACIGVYNIMNLVGQSVYGNVTAFKFLQQKVASQPNNKFTIWITGHSLGGALSPTLALFLNDTWADTLSNKNVMINCLPVAGPTAGGKIWASYYMSRIPNTIRVWNRKDVVPHLSEVAMVDDIADLYKSDNIKPDMGTKAGLDLAKTALKPYGYTQILGDNKGFVMGYFNSSDSINSNVYSGSFAGQAGCQHVPAYAHYFGVDSFQTHVQTLLHYKVPYFSEGYHAPAILDSGKYPIIPASFYNK